MHCTIIKKSQVKNLVTEIEALGCNKLPLTAGGDRDPRKFYLVHRKQKEELRKLCPT